MPTTSKGKATLIRLSRTRRCLDVHELLTVLLDRGIKGVFLEGGPTLAGSFRREHCVDRIVNYVAPALLGAGKNALGDAGIETMVSCLEGPVWRLDLVSVRPACLVGLGCGVRPGRTPTDAD